MNPYEVLRNINEVLFYIENTDRPSRSFVHSRLATIIHRIHKADIKESLSDHFAKVGYEGMIRSFTKQERVVPAWNTLGLTKGVFIDFAKMILEDELDRENSSMVGGVRIFEERDIDRMGNDIKMMMGAEPYIGESRSTLGARPADLARVPKEKREQAFTAFKEAITQDPRFLLILNTKSSYEYKNKIKLLNEPPLSSSFKGLLNESTSDLMLVVENTLRSKITDFEDELDRERVDIYWNPKTYNSLPKNDQEVLKTILEQMLINPTLPVPELRLDVFEHVMTSGYVPISHYENIFNVIDQNISKISKEWIDKVMNNVKFKFISDELNENVSSGG